MRKNVTYATMPRFLLWKCLYECSRDRLLYKKVADGLSEHLHVKLQFFVQNLKFE